MCLSILALLVWSDVLLAQYSFPYSQFIESVDGQNIQPNGSIVQDTQGYLWIPTSDGLVRYDGYELEVFRRSQTDTTGSLADHIQTLQIGNDDRIFLITHFQGFSIFDPKTERFQNWHPGSQDTTAIFISKLAEVVEEKDGSFWMGRRGFQHWYPQKDSLSYFYPSDYFAFKGDTAQAIDMVTNLINDPQNPNYLWVATKFGLLRFDKKSEQLLHFPVADGSDAASAFRRPRGMIFGEDGKIYLATWGYGLTSFDTLSKEWKTHYFFGKKDPKHVYNYVSGVAKKSPTELWVTGPQRGLFVFNTASQKFRLVAPHKTITDLHQNSPYCLDRDMLGVMEDKNRAIWMYHYEGLNVIHPQQQMFKKILLRRTVWKVFPGPEKGKLYLPVAGRRMYSYDQKTNTLDTLWMAKTNFRHPLEYIAHAPDGEFWLMGRDRFFKLDGKGRIVRREVPPFDSLQKVPNMLDNSLAWRFLIDRQSNLWIPFKRNGLMKIALSSGAYQHYSFSYDELGKEIKYDYPGDMVTTGEQRIWFAYHNGLCFTDDFGKTWTHYPATTPVDNNSDFREMNALQPDHQGRLWISSEQKGLYYLYYNQPPPHSIHALTLKDGLPSLYIYDLELDASGHLWIISDKGLTKMNTDNLTFEHFGPEYGLNGLEELTLLPSGEMALGAVGGFYLFHPDSVHVDTTTYRVILKDFRIFGESFNREAAIQFLPKIKLNHDENFFSFGFSAPNFWAPHLIKYQYQLVGVDPHWVEAGKQRLANYTAITPGHYTFKLRASNVKGEWNETITEVDLIITPPWWQTWWAYALYAIIGLLALALIYLYQRHRWQLQTNLQLEQERAERLKELDHFKSRFYTNITHEFRTPLTVIKGMTNQITGNEKIKVLIKRNSNRLLNLVNQLLDLSKLESKSLNIDWIHGDVVAYLRYLTESCHSLAENKKIELTFVSREAELWMDFDENILQQILINLLSNAIKFTPGQGRVSVLVEKILASGVYYLSVSVGDNGEGIPQEKLPHIFDRFYQVDDPNSSRDTRRGEGSGIGLALVKELIQLLEGNIEVESEVGNGSSFRAYLPIQQQVDKTSELQVPSPLQLDRMEGKGKLYQELHNPVSSDNAQPMVLIIEDNADVTEYIISCLSPNYILQTAANGKTGVEKAIEFIPDVIISDVMMPEMDGFEVCQQIKADRRTSHIPVILLTAKATQQDKVAGLSYGADAYLVKPFDKEELLVRLQNLTALSKKLQERLSTPIISIDQLDEFESREATFLKELHEIIEANLNKDQFNTSFLCQAIAMSRTQLHRKLKALIDQTPANYIRTIRLQRAKFLLESTDYPIGDIADQVGFKDFSHFSRSFAKEFGVKPSGTRN